MKSRLFTIIVAILSVAALFSCTTDSPVKEKKQLTPPSIESITDQTASSFTVNWISVEDATYYKYILTGGEQEIKSFTSETTVSFSDLQPGEYEFKVNASGDENTTIESEYSVYNITLVKEPEFTFIIDNVTATTATLGAIPAESVDTYYYDIAESFYIDELGGEEAFVEYIVALLENFTEEYNMPLESLLSSGETSFGYSELTPNTEYVVYAFGITTKGKVTTELYYEAFTTADNKVEPSDKLKEFMGTWNVTFDKTAQWGQDPSDGMYYPNISNEQWSTTLSIEHHTNSGNANRAVIFGWSALGYEYYAFGEVDGADRLVLYNQEVIGAEENGYAPTWMALANVIEASGNTSVSIAGTGNFPVYMLTLKNGTIEARRYMEEAEDGNIYEMIAYDIYAVGNSGYSLYHTNKMSAGDATFTAAAPSVRLTKFKSLEMMEQVLPLRKFESFRIPTVDLYR